MARMPRGVSSGRLREYLVQQATDFRDSYGHLDPQVHAELSKPVDALRSGEAFHLHRHSLPDDHPARAAGHPADDLVLGADDVLRPAESGQ
ncbi:hypothetical protein RW1_040_00380 [Rhodococcus wratislaviensis NBRC 100605]|uniref:Uncharacterized protein n=1 Tax=Rhodococcus wratislaviensis NBRC 100605 TaxID=1219028 RepID=X0Q8Y6_RHOWR|nr:hypothetical protein RW1_040_00380 [Rhodococcus wratislaviensis NBRC 100605]